MIDGIPNEFDNLTYFVVDYDSILSGWSNQEKRDSRKRVNAGIGRQGTQSYLDTVHRKDVKTLFGDEGALTQTAGKALYRLDANQYANEQELIDAVNAEIADELGKAINAVRTKVSVTVVGGQ